MFSEHFMYIYIYNIYLIIDENEAYENYSNGN